MGEFDFPTVEMKDIAREEVFKSDPESAELLNRFESGEAFVVERPFQALEIGSQILVEHLNQKFSPEGETPREYHNVEHSLLVLKGCGELFGQMRDKCPYALLDMSPAEYESMNDVERETQLNVAEAYMAILALGHDAVQDGYVHPESGELVLDRTVVSDKTGLGFEYRSYINGNEVESARYIHKLLNSFEYADGTKVFDEKVYSLDRVWSDVYRTCPMFHYDEENKLTGITQPKITDEVHMTGIVLGQMDLNKHLISDPETSRDMSDAVFKEKYAWIGNFIDNGAENAVPGIKRIIESEGEGELKGLAIMYAADHLRFQEKFMQDQLTMQVDFRVRILPRYVEKKRYEEKVLGVFGNYFLKRRADDLTAYQANGQYARQRAETVLSRTEELVGSDDVDGAFRYIMQEIRYEFPDEQ